MGTDGEGRGPLRGVNIGETIGTLSEAEQSATAATFSCALGVVGESEDYAGVDTGELTNSGD